MDVLFDVAAEVTVNVRDRSDTAAFGAAMEQLAIAELLRRGRKVAVPVVDDDGVDLVVDYRVTVQVKGSREKRMETMPGYVYSAFSWRFKGEGMRADFAALAGEKNDGSLRWWIVPASLIAGRQSVSIYESARTRSPLLEYEGHWDGIGG